MGQIQTSIGLITGLPIQDTVDQLLQISARPRDLLVSRSADLEKQQVAVTELMAKVISAEFAADRITPALFDKREATSSNSAALDVAVTGTPAQGSHQFTPLAKAQAHQALSSGVADADAALAEGVLSVRFGGFVDQGVDLEQLNGGAGVERGEIRITNRDGDSKKVDLRFVRSIDDVIEAINETDGLDVRASTQGGRIVLTDQTGSSSSNLRVEEVSGGSTAADLGLGGIDVAASSATGADIVTIAADTQLAYLNDGNGVGIDDALADLTVSFRDGSEDLLLDFHEVARGERQATGATKPTAGVDARLIFSAVANGANSDGVTVEFVDNASIAKGSETVAFDAEQNKLTFQIDAGQTTANDIVAALANDSDASAHFTARVDANGSGEGVVDVADTATLSGGAAESAKNELTLGDLIETINAADRDRLRAQFASDGKSIELIDLTSDAGGTFAVASNANGALAEELGLTGAAVGDTLSSRALAGGLKTTLLSTLNGGKGLTLGTLSLTDRSGGQQDVDLSGAATLDDVIDAINGAGLGIEAGVNSDGSGLELKDTSGGSGSLIVASTDETAAQLGLAGTYDTHAVDSGSLARQNVTRRTKLADLNGGRGVSIGQFQITNSLGGTKTIAIDANDTTIGDVIDKITAANHGVTAQINAAGDGIELVDQLDGTKTLKVTDYGFDRAASDLHLAGEAVATTIDSQPAQVLDGSTSIHITLDGEKSLRDVATEINNLGLGVSASVFSSGAGVTPFRLSLSATQTGEASRFAAVTTGASLAFSEVVNGQDAELLVGSANSSGVLATSRDGVFSEILEGASLIVNSASNDTVSINVSTTDSALVSGVQLFVDEYNKLRDKLDDLTFFNEVEKTTGVLFGSNETLRIDTELGNLLSGRFRNVGDIQSLEAVGVSLTDDGRLSFDSSKLKNKFAVNADSVEEFFTDPDFGFVKQMHDLMEQFAGRDNSLLVNRAESLGRKIDSYSERIEGYNISLEREREALLKQFYDMEVAIGKLQSNIDYLSSISYIGADSLGG